MEHPWLTIILAGIFVGCFAATPMMIWWAWAWFKKRREIPPVDPRVQFRTQLWPGEGNVVQFRRMKQ